MEEYDFTSYDSGPGNEFDRKRRKRKKVRLWLGQPKRFDLVKKGVKVRGRKKKFQEAEPSSNSNQTIPVGMCDTEEAMAAAILLQMSSHGGNMDQCRESPPIWTEEESRHFPRPKGPSWIIDHDYAIQPHKYGGHRHDYYKRKSGITKSKKTKANTYQEPFTDIHIVEQSSFAEHGCEGSEPLIGWNNGSIQEIGDETEQSKDGNVWYQSDQLDSSMESDTILHLNDDVGILKLSQSEGIDAEASEIDMRAVLDNIKGDVEYRTVVITDDDDNIIQNWNENISYGNYEIGESGSSGQKTGCESEQLCWRCHQQLDSSRTEDNDAQPGTSLSQQTTTLHREQPGNTPDLIPMSVEGNRLQGTRLSEDGHQSVREITNLSEDLVRNLENANMLENFMVLFRTIAAGYVPDLSECDDLKSMKSGVNRLPIGITSNG